MENKRKCQRFNVPLITYIRVPKKKGYVINQFLTKDISENGLYICTDNLSLFSLGDEIDIMVDDKEKKYYEGKARVVRSAKVFSMDDEPVESGYGLFLMDMAGEYADLMKEASNK
ncbi:MAG: PilZ domain-containing protein [Spirochaetales bacterium]|nr:PilZ domain-containing protein [Spirochaetales bacterium]